MPTTRSKKGQTSSRGGTAKKTPAKRQQATAPQGAEGGALDKFFHDSLKDIYWAEKHLVKTLPKMKKAATTDALKEAIDDHLAQTEEQVARLEQVFELLDKKPQAKKCDAMEGLTKEGDSIVEETEEGTATRDVGIIMAAQKVEHYEIATYGGLVQLAKTMGNDEIAGILQQTLDEEKEADELLTQIAENDINWQAETEGEEGEEGEEEEEATEEDEE